MSKKIDNVRDKDCYVEINVAFDEEKHSRYNFNIMYEGNFEIECASREAMIYLRDCINNALDYVEKMEGGEDEQD